MCREEGDQEEGKDEESREVGELAGDDVVECRFEDEVVEKKGRGSEDEGWGGDQMMRVRGGV